jgi:DNA-binding transcriptional ArsR family regulator
MQISELRDTVTTRLLEFAWDEWAQMGVFATPRRESPWAADPEAHLVFTLQVARSDPRLFDELLDWFATNSSQISVQRLRNMCIKDDEALCEAAIEWVVQNGDRPRRLVSRPKTRRAPGEPLFYGRRKPTRLDESFAAFGFQRPPAQRTRKSRHPDPRRPINLAFLFRNVFGVGSRAEIMRFLLTASGHAPSSRPQFTTLAIADAAGFAKRNVQEALTALVDAGAIELARRGNEHLYSIDSEAWRTTLRIDGRLPQYRDWAQALLGVRVLHRWLWQGDLDALTPYMLASEARLLWGQIDSAFGHAGIPVRPARPAEGEEFWDVFVDQVDQVLARLDSPLPW